MSQRANKNPNPRARVTSKQQLQESPIIGLSPDDDVGVKPPEGPGQTGAPEK